MARISDELPKILIESSHVSRPIGCIFIEDGKPLKLSKRSIINIFDWLDYFKHCNLDGL